MRHLERTHGISIASLREHFQKDHFVLLLRFLARCVLTSIQRLLEHHSPGVELYLDPADLNFQELADMVSRSVDQKKIDHHMFQTKTDDVPNWEGGRPRPSKW